MSLTVREDPPTQPAPNKGIRPKVVLGGIVAVLLITAPLEVLILSRVEAGTWSPVKALAVAISALTLSTTLTSAVQVTSDHARWSATARDVLQFVTVLLGIAVAVLGIVAALAA